LTAKEQERQVDLAKLESLQRTLQANEEQLARTQNDMIDGASKKRDLDEARATLSAALGKVESERLKYEKEKAELLEDLRSKESALATLQNEAAVAASHISEYNAKLSNLTEMKDTELRSIREELKSLAAQRDGLLIQLQNQEGQLAEVRDSVAKTEKAAAQVDGLKADLEHKAANLEQTETASTQLRAHLTALSEENEKVKLELQTLRGKHDTAVENSKLLAAKIKQMNEEAKEQAQTASQAEGRLRELQNTLEEMHLRLKNETELHAASKTALESLEQRLSAAADQLADKSTTERIKQLSAEMESLRIELTDKTRELGAVDGSYQQSEKLNAALKKKLLALSEQNQALESRLAHQDQNDQKAMEKLKGALARLLSEQEQSKTLLEAKQALVSDLRHQVEEDRKLLHQQTADYNAKLSASEQKAAEVLREVRGEASQTLARLEKKLSDAVSELERMKSQHSAVDGKTQDQLAGLMAQLKEAESRNDNLTSAVEAKSKEIERTKSSLSESEGNVALLSRALSEAQGTLAGKSRELEQANESLKQHSALNKKLGAKVIQLQEKLKSTEGTAGQLEGKSQDIQTELATYQKKYSEARERLKLAVATVEKHKLDIKELAGNNTSLKRDLEAEVTRTETLQAQLDALQQELEATKGHLQLAAASVETMDVRLQELGTDHTRLKQDFEELAQENRGAKKRKDDLEMELDELKSKLHRLESDSENTVQEAESEATHLREQIRALERRVDDQSDQHTALLHDLSLQQEANNQLKLELADQQSETEAYSVAMNERLAQETDIFAARLAEEREKTAALVVEKAQLLQQLADLQDERASLQSQLQDTKDVTLSIRADHSQVDLTNAALQTKLATVQEQLNEVEAQLQKTQESLDRQTSELQQSRRDLQLAQAANVKLREDADALVAEEVKLLKGQHAHALTQTKDEMARALQAQKDAATAQIQQLEKSIADLSSEQDAGEEGRRSLQSESERLERDLASARAALEQSEQKLNDRVQELERLLAGATNSCEEMSSKLKSLEAQNHLMTAEGEAQAAEQSRVTQAKADVEAEAAALRLANVEKQQLLERLQQQLALAAGNASEAETEMGKAEARHASALLAKDNDLAEARSETISLRKALDAAETKLAEAISQQQLAQISTKHERELASQDSDLVKQQNRELFDRNSVLQQKVESLEAEVAERDTEYDMVKLQLQGVKTQLSRREADAHAHLQESEQKWAIALQRAEEQYATLQLQQSQDTIQHQSELTQLHGRLTAAETGLEQQRSQLALASEEKARLVQQLESQSAELVAVRQAHESLDRQLATTDEQREHQMADSTREQVALTDSLNAEKKLRTDLEARLEKEVFQAQQAAEELSHRSAELEELRLERASQDDRLAKLQNDLLSVQQRVTELQAETAARQSDQQEAERLAGKHQAEVTVARDELDSIKLQTSQSLEQLKRELSNAQV
jgi:chromosome segregation ATPase